MKALNSMKNFLFIIGVIFFHSYSQAQNWGTDFEKAKLEASTEHKPILLVFQGSDWCAPCMKLDREIWTSETFKNYSKNHLILLKADFPRRKQNALSAEQKEKNNLLAETYNKNGFFPFVVLLDSNGKVLGTTGYKKISPEEYITELNSFYNAH